MQAFFETLFSSVYLIFSVSAGAFMVAKAGGEPLIKKFGIMSMFLGAGDAFYFIPRTYALWTSGPQANASLLGAGRLIASVAMTMFYLNLYYIWREKYRVNARPKLTAAIWSLTILRTALCLFPQNQWLIAYPSLFWRILRNIPLAILVGIIAEIFNAEIRKSADKSFKFISLAIIASFILHFNLELRIDSAPLAWIFIIPLILINIWIVSMGLGLLRRENKIKLVSDA